ncbi:unnamed protein product [Blepharisma stoltei]|uniref:Glycosyltransferase n=1 Tax=Blepharisma stoltei TaxID=1481888 RepID=A0AAU9K814_9CILI|nr:unnamed protein product [Blepharisma stoltei]
MEKLAKSLLFFILTASYFFAVADASTETLKADTPVYCEPSMLHESSHEDSLRSKNISERAEQNNSTGRKLKIAIIGCIAIGHITPTIDMTRALKSKGHDVVYYAPIYTQNLIESTGAKFIPYPEQKLAKVTPLDKKEIRVNETGLLLIAAFGGYTDYIMPWFLENFEKEQFDAVIYTSFAIWGNAVASYFKIPYLCLGTSVLPAEDNAWNETHFYDEGKEQQLEFTNRLHNKYNTTAVNLIEMFSCSYAKKVLMVSSQKFLEAASDHRFSEPEKYFFLSSISSQTSKNFISKLKENSIIYLSLGTTFNQRPDIFESIMTYFNQTKYELIVSAGMNEKLYQALTSKNYSSNIKINLYTNQVRLLKDVAIFITHAGLNSIKEAISFTIPTVTIPQGADQFWISKAIKDLKIGASVEDYEGSLDDKFKAAFQEIEQNFETYKENLKNVQKNYFDGPSFDESIMDLENYLLDITDKQ